MKNFEKLNGMEQYRIEMRIAELNCEIELWADLEEDEKFEAAKKELAEIIGSIENGKELYDKLTAEWLIYNDRAEREAA